jgi:uncharacterized DUF497 family protein
MENISIRELLWNDMNETHIWERHQLTREIVEEACYGDPRYIKVRDTYHKRLLVLAPLQNKRLLTVILAPLPDDVYYPVSVRIASKKERSEYREWKAEKDL